MKTLLYKDQIYNARELADLTGVKYTTLIERLKRGYTVEEAVEYNARIPESIMEFDAASDLQDWDGITTDDLYSIYWKWCNNNHLPKESKVHFVRSIKKLHPEIRVAPARVKSYDSINYKRVVKLDKHITKKCAPKIY